MKIRKLLLSFLAGIALIFELLPNGVVLRFMNPEGEPWVRTYSYFSLVPYGYANFGPLIAAVLTCVLIILIAISWFKYSRGLNTAIMCVSGIATISSLSPVLYGFEYVTAIAIVVTALLAAIFVECLIRAKD